MRVVDVEEGRRLTIQQPGPGGRKAAAGSAARHQQLIHGFAVRHHRELLGRPAPAPALGDLGPTRARSLAELGRVPQRRGSGR